MVIMCRYMPSAKRAYIRRIYQTRQYVYNRISDLQIIIHHRTDAVQQLASCEILETSI